MEQIPSILVSTKIHIPRQRAGSMIRQRLMHHVDTQNVCNLFLIEAPAGYGKTTLLLDWINQLQLTGYKTAWYALDESDNESSSFAVYLLNCISNAVKGNQEIQHLLQRLKGMTDVNLIWLIQSLINLLAELDEKMVIVLDDYHLISKPEIHQAMQYFLENLPQSNKVVISSRSTPPFPLARWQVKARLCQIGTDDLRFSPDEVGEFLNRVMGLNLSPEVISALDKRTEGWAAGLQIAGISLSGKISPDVVLQTFQGDQQVLLAYLIEEVYVNLPESVQHFLMQTAIFGRFCVEMCDAFLSLAKPGEIILEEIERNHLFLVQLDDTHDWFRYHHLFSAFLQSRLAKEMPKKAPILHQKASLWFKEKQLYREAVQQAFLSNDWHFATALVSELGFYMIIHSEISVLYEWTVAFPEDVMLANPLLCILQSWALVYRYQKQNRMRIESRLSQAENAIAVMQDKEEAANLSEHLAVVRTFLSMAPDPDVDIQHYLQQARQMLTPYPQGHPGQYSALLTSAYAYLADQSVSEAEQTLLQARQAAFNGQLYFGYVEATFHLARLKQNCGKNEEARALCQHGKMEINHLLPNAEKLLPAIGSLDIVLGSILVEENQLKEAAQALQYGLALIGTGSNPYYLFVVYFGLSRCSMLAGQTSLALDYLDQLSDLWPDIAFFTQGQRLIVQHHCHDMTAEFVPEVEHWCTEVGNLFLACDFIPGMGPLGAAQVYYHTAINWMRLMGMLGRFAAAEKFYQRLLEKAEQQNLVERVSQLKLLSRLSMDIHVKKQGVSSIDQALIEPLSNREVDVLRLVALGASNQEIAQKLVITVGTVKSHINHILRKLCAQNRTEAVARARDQEII
ncbi:MAG: hypothetical protein JEZ00_21525 [Anaerolineaceae bacterium]|nr:hypothetical protein [Anaerolineaceae bacterium]